MSTPWLVHTRVILRSAYERRSEFSATELSWLVEGCLPGLDNVIIAGRSADRKAAAADDEGTYNGRSDDEGDGSRSRSRSTHQGGDTYEVPSGLAVGLARELAQRQQAKETTGGEKDGEVEPVAAVLAGYVSASLLERSNGVL